jgi:hypothetical protein
MEQGQVPADSRPPGEAGPGPEKSVGPVPTEKAEAPGLVHEGLDLGGAVTYRETVAKGEGYLELTISQDAMLATADLHPPAEGAAPLAIDQAQALCARLGIVRGQDWEGLADAILRCNLDHAVERNVVVARGREARPIVVEHAVPEARFLAKPQAPSKDSLTYDFHERQALIVVRKGEVLARVVPSSPGEDGYDIRGRELPAPRHEARGVHPGKNSALEEGCIVALVDGILAPPGELGSGNLDIEEILLVHGDVDYHTGHIVFPGDVVIDGAVSDGFKVYSGASIRCKTTMDAFDVNAKKDLICDQGIIGRKKAQVRVGGELKAKFIQNCRVAVRGDVHVTTAIVNSRVYSLGRIDLGDKGVIMGGETYAIHGLKTGRLGSEAHQATVIHAGTDFTVQQRLDQANEKLRILALGAHRAKEEAAGEANPSLDALLSRSKTAEAMLQGHIAALLGNLDADEDAVVEVSGDIFPGVTIEICRVTMEVSEVIHGCRFHLDKSTGRIVADRGGRGGEAKKPAAGGGPRPGSGEEEREPGRAPSPRPKEARRPGA